MSILSGVTSGAVSRTYAENLNVSEEASASSTPAAVGTPSNASDLKWQISQLVEDHEIGMNEAIGDLARFPLGLLLFMRLDQLND